MLIKNSVLDFIEPFMKYDTINTFKYNYNYWFAYLLHGRFHKSFGAEIVYDIDENGEYYFATRIGKEVYDVTGIVTREGEWQTWKEENLIES